MITGIRQNHNLFMHAVLSVMGANDKMSNSTGKIQSSLILKIGSH